MLFIDVVIEDMQTLGDAALLDTSSPFDEAIVFGEVRGLTAGRKAHAGDGHYEQAAGAGKDYDHCS